MLSSLKGPCVAAFLASVVVCTPAVFSANQAQRIPPTSVVPAPEIQVGKTVDGEIEGGKAVRFPVSLTKGEFVHVIVEQRGVDVIAGLFRPDGTLLLAAEEIADVFQPENLVAIADVTGSWYVDVREGFTGRPGGRYAIRLETVRAAVPEDQVRIDAERAFARAHQIFLKGDFKQLPDAVGQVQLALNASRTLTDRNGELKCLIALTELQGVLSQPEVLETARSAERLAAELHDDVSRAKALEFLGIAMQRTGDFPGSARPFDEALAIYTRLGHWQGEAAILNELGVVLGRTGDGDRALARFEEALALATKHQDGIVFSILNNIGITYKNVGEYAKAVDTYERILAATGLGRVTRENALNNAGNVQRLMGHDREALAMHLQALDLAREMGDKESEARSLNTIGQTYFRLGDYATALTNEQESLTIRRTLGDLSGQASSLQSIGRTLQTLGRADDAYTNLTEALAIRQTIRDQYGEPDTLETMAMVDRDRGNLSLAIEHVRAAVELDEQLRERITSPELRATFVAAELDKYSLYIDLLQQQDAAQPGRGHAAEALQITERARARVLLESLLNARVDLRQGIDPALLERERSLQKQLNTASSQISRALGSHKEPPGDLVETYERLTDEYQKHLTLIRQQNPHYAAMTHPQPLGASEIQQVVDQGTIVLEFELGNDHSWLWAVTPTTITSVALPARQEIDAAARALYENVTARQRRAGETTAAYTRRVAAADAERDGKAAAISRLLFSGIAQQLRSEWRDKRLAIVADGSLEYVPFAALPIPGAGARTLLASRHEIVKIPSVSVLAVLRSESTRRTPAPHTLAVVADPVFDASDPRVAAATSTGKDRIALRSDFDESLYIRAGLSRLPFSREEANAITALVPSKEVLEAVDFDATRTTALDGSLAGYRIVHFATHGVLDSERPSLSGLVFSLVDQHGQRQDGFVRLHDIYNMKLNADLVVLSACQTALGKDIKGEGLIGLTRAFMYAGAPRVVASLWEVSDLATAELMKKFYAAMLQRHLPPAAALRTAQLQMSQDSRWSSPYYWAGFVFQGDWR